MPVASGTLMDKNSLALSPLRQALRSGGVRRYSTKGVGQYRL